MEAPQPSSRKTRPKSSRFAYVKVEASVARCLRTPPYAAKRKGFVWDFAPLTRREQPEHCCRLQLCVSPITAVQCRAKVDPLRPRRSCFAPAEALHVSKGLGWRRRALPPGPKGLFRSPFIAIVSPKDDLGNIGAMGRKCKWGAMLSRRPTAQSSPFQTGDLHRAGAGSPFRCHQQKPHRHGARSL